jgi:hypothetical protein
MVHDISSRVHETILNAYMHKTCMYAQHMHADMLILRNQTNTTRTVYIHIQNITPTEFKMLSSLQPVVDGMKLLLQYTTTYIYILYVAGQTILPSWMIKDSSQKQRRSALISNSKMVSYSLIYIACTVKPLETYMYTTHTYSALLWYYVTVVRKHT